MNSEKLRHLTCYEPVWFAEDLSNNEENVREAVKQNGRLLMLASEDLRNNSVDCNLWGLQNRC